MTPCTTFWEILREAEDIIERAKKNPRYKNCDFFFRGEYHRFKPFGAPEPPPPDQCQPSILRKEIRRQNEKKIFYETLRRYPEFFRHDMKTIETLYKFEHYGVPTRLMNISEDLRLSAAMATIPFNSGVKSEYNECNSFIYVYAVEKSRIKYSDSDIVTAIAAAVKLDDDKITLSHDGLGYLGYEAKIDRPGFSVSERWIRDMLLQDLPHVWCVKPILSTERIQRQSGCFFLFGFSDNKKLIPATFSEADFSNRDAATYGIARVGVVTIHGDKKKAVAKELRRVGMAEYQYYPELSSFARYLVRCVDDEEDLGL